MAHAVGPTVILLRARPRLGRSVRLRFERCGDRFLLLRGERGIELNSTARELLHLCTGQRTVEQIIHILTVAHQHASAEAIGRRVIATLSDLEARALLRRART